MRRRACHVKGGGKPAASATAMLLAPLPRLVLPTAQPLFCRGKCPVDEGFPQVEPAALSQIVGQSGQHGIRRAFLSPALEPSVADLAAWRIPTLP